MASPHIPDCSDHAGIRATGSRQRRLSGSEIGIADSIIFSLQQSGAPVTETGETSETPDRGPQKFFSLFSMF